MNQAELSENSDKMKTIEKPAVIVPGQPPPLPKPFSPKQPPVLSNPTTMEHHKAAIPNGTYFNTLSFRKLGFVMFGFNGRISRRDCWLYGVIPSFLALLAFIYATRLIVKYVGDDISIIFATMGVFFTLTTWIFLALAIKRLHDRNKSALWVLVGVAPLVGLILNIFTSMMLPGLIALRLSEICYIVASLPILVLGVIPYFLVDVFLVKGTDGANRFGPETDREISANADTRRILILLFACALPLLYLFSFTFKHASLNAEANKQLTEQAADGELHHIPYTQDIEKITPHSMVKVAGTWNWRFFYWGTVYGDESHLHEMTLIGQGVPKEIIKAVNFLNPTPFILFCLLCFAPATALLKFQKL